MVSQVKYDYMLIRIRTWLCQIFMVEYTFLIHWKSCEPHIEKVVNMW